MDWSMVLAIAALLVVGILFIYSASYRSDDLPVAPFYQKQMVWALVGLGFFLMLVLIDYHRFRDAAWWLYVVGLVLLVLVLIPGVGKKVYGAYRWLSLFGMQVQPSEFGKLATLIVLARFLGRPGRDCPEPALRVPGADDHRRPVPADRQGAGPRHGHDAGAGGVLHDVRGGRAAQVPGRARRHRRPADAARLVRARRLPEGAHPGVLRRRARSAGRGLEQDPVGDRRRVRAGFRARDI